MPILGFGIEQVLRRARRRPPAEILSNVALRSGVTRVEIARPSGFVFGACDYAFLCIPALARGHESPKLLGDRTERARLRLPTSTHRTQLSERSRAGQCAILTII